MIDAAAYGRALFALTQEAGEEERVRGELSIVRTALQREPQYATLLDTPAVQTEEKLGLLKQAFGAVQPLLLNFLCLLCEKRAYSQFSACADAFGQCYDEAHHLLRAQAITAVPMQERQMTALREKLERITGKTVILSNTTDPSLLGGITLRCGGVQLDDSIRFRLDKLRRSLSDTIV